MFWRVRCTMKAAVFPKSSRQIFERFVRLAPANSDDAGSGSAGDLPEHHDASWRIIWAEPASGGGLCVAFTLPATAQSPLVPETLLRPPIPTQC